MEQKKENIAKSYVYKTEINDKKNEKTSKFLVLKKSNDALWLSEFKQLEVADNFLSQDVFKIVLRDPKASDDTKGIKAQDGKGVKFERVGSSVTINSYLMTYGDNWRDEFKFELEDDLFSSYLKVAQNEKAVNEILVKERGPKAAPTFG